MENITLSTVLKMRDSLLLKKQIPILQYKITENIEKQKAIEIEIISNYAYIESINTELNRLRIIAENTQKDDIICELSIQQRVFDILQRDYDDLIKQYSILIHENTHLINIPITLGAVRAGRAGRAASVDYVVKSFAEITADFQTIINKYINIHLDILRVDQSTEHHSTKEIKINNFIFIIYLINVRGDGACGLNALIKAYIEKNTDIILPYAPTWMPNCVADIKLLLLSLVQLLAQNPDNMHFIESLYNNPDNIKYRVSNFETYGAMLCNQEYFITNFEIRLFAILVKMQVNVIRFNSYQHIELYQSFLGSGSPVIQPLSNNNTQLTIAHIPGHYMYVKEISDVNQVPSIPQIEFPLGLY